jgi:hypothetical protein
LLGEHLGKSGLADQIEMIEYVIRILWHVLDIVVSGGSLLNGCQEKVGWLVPASGFASGVHTVMGCVISENIYSGFVPVS